MWWDLKEQDKEEWKKHELYLENLQFVFHHIVDTREVHKNTDKGGGYNAHKTIKTFILVFARGHMHITITDKNIK